MSKLRKPATLFVLASLALTAGCGARQVAPAEYFQMMRSSRLPIREAARPLGRCFVMEYTRQDGGREKISVPRGELEAWAREQPELARISRGYAAGFTYGYERGLAGQALYDKDDPTMTSLLSADVRQPGSDIDKQLEPWRRGAEIGHARGQAAAAKE